MWSRFLKLNHHPIYRFINRSCSNSRPCKADKSWPKVVFSGIQPTGSVHIGNYFGAIKQWLDLQNNKENMMLSIVDLHSITLPQDPKLLKNNIFEMTATLLACGIDSDKTIIFLQSSVARHSELCWILGCFSTMARLSHLPQYKEKSELLKEVPLGLFIYPILQAADILLYKSTHVPVGEDQLQHLQMAQQIVKTFNYKFGTTFPRPVPIISHGSKLKSIRNPTKKMSKSDSDEKSRIHLTDSSDVIHKKIKKAVTDFTPEITYDPVVRPGISNLIDIYCLVSNKIPEEVCEECDGFDTVRFKQMVSDAMCEYVKPIREKIEILLSDRSHLTKVLEKGSANACARADITMKEVFDKVGIGCT